MGELIQISDLVLECNNCECQSWNVHVDQAGRITALVCADDFAENCANMIDITDLGDLVVYDED